MNNSENPKDSIITITVSSETIRRDPPPPPPKEVPKSVFKTINQWLNHLCEIEHPDSIFSYHIGIIQYTKENIYVLTLGGSKKDLEGQSAVFPDYEPADMYFPLPKEETNGLTWQQIEDKITEQLINFTKTEKFKNSFFVKAKLIRVDFNSKIIWGKE